MGHLAETLHILGHARKLFQVFLRRFRQLRHFGDLFGGTTQLLDTVGKVFRIFFAHIQAETAQSGSLLAAQIDFQPASDLVIGRILRRVDQIGHRRIGEIRTVERILRFQYREHFFPVIFIEWLFKCGDKEYQCLYRHGHKQDLVTIRQVQQLEQGADNNDGGTPAITEIQYPLAFFTGEVHFYSVFISSIFSHNIMYIR